MVRRALFRRRLNQSVREHARADAAVKEVFGAWRARDAAPFRTKPSKLSREQKVDLFSKSIREQFARKAKEDARLRRSGSVFKTVARNVADPKASLRLFRMKHLPTRRMRGKIRRTRFFGSTGMEPSKPF
ncbi:MAG: hypothetical protein NTZ73_04410 [Candidatus Diapherotrites archaeon]|nr:hypothetical protein [Candidatus Diapherotrites archaeon]